MENLAPNMLMWLASACTGLAVAIMVWKFWPRQMIAEAAEIRSEGGGGPVSAARRVMFDKMVPLSSPLLTEKQKSNLEQQLLMMGAPDLRPVDIITMHIFSVLFFTSVFFVFFYQFEAPLLWTFFPAVVGLALPRIWMRDQIKRRHLAIGRAMPFNLDLLTLSVEAGLDFQGAVATVVEKGIPGPLTEEMGIMMREIRMGKTREESLRNLSDRCQFSPLTQFVSNLIQADRMGTSLGKILRVQSAQLRIARTQRAEKLANEAPVKMLFPLIFCIFPTVFMILFGPIVYRYIQGGP